MGDRLYRKKDGTTWYGYFYDATGKRRVVCTKQQDRAAARAVLRKLEREAHAQGGAPADKPAEEGERTRHTIADALDYLVTHAGSDLAPATLKMYSEKGGHILRLMGEFDVNALTLDQSQDYINERLAEKAHRETVRKELVTLRRALTLANERGFLRADPRGLIPRFRVRYVPRSRYLTEKELPKLLLALPANRRHWVALAVYTGSRASEVESLRWEHVDMKNARLLLSGTKTAKSRRWVPIAAPLLRLLEAVDEEDRTGPVVEPWGNARRDLAVACQAAGIDRVSPNDLRRTFASWLKQRGVDSMVVARLLGHTTSRMVELVYGHLDDRTTAAAVSTLPAVPGSKWVAAGQRSRRRVRRVRSAEGRNSSQVSVPRVGIEPTTRGFSVRCSTS